MKNRKMVTRSHHALSSLSGICTLAAVVLSSVSLTLPAARADLVTAFNFNNGPTTGSANALTLASTSGQTSAITTTGFAAANVVVFSGTTINAVSGDVAGVSLALQGGTGAGAGGTGGNNGGSIIFSVNGSQLSNLDVSYATQGTSTGFKTQALSYSLDGTTFTPFGSNTAIPTAFAAVNFDLSSITGINNQPTVYFELTFTGATATAGNNRIDNLQVNTVPEPSTVLGSALLIGAATWSQRRRLQGLFA